MLYDQCTGWACRWRKDLIIIGGDPSTLDDGASMCGAGNGLRDRGVVHARRQLYSGAPAEMIAEVAANQPDVLIAMATHVQRSVADTLVRTTSTPIFLVHNGASPSSHSWTLRRILAPLDGSALARQLLPLARVLAEVGLCLTALLAGQPPAPIQLGFIPWAMRALLLIPLLQIAGVAATLRLLRRWRRDPALRPSRGRMWGLHILPPLIPNLLVALTLLPMLGKMRGYLMLFNPDVSWVALICGSFAGIWTFLRTGLILQTLRKSRRRKP
jgi:hypothetical protein